MVRPPLRSTVLLPLELLHKLQMASMSVQSSSTMMRVRLTVALASSIASGDMGKPSLGDVSGAVDAIDDINDWGYEGTTGVGGDDAFLLWSLPSIAPNLTISSAGTDATEGGGQDGTNPLLSHSSTQLVQLRSVLVSRRLKVVRKSVLRISRSQWRV